MAGESPEWEMVLTHVGLGLLHEDVGTRLDVYYIIASL
jgi:hypothetical protein